MLRAHTSAHERPENEGDGDRDGDNDECHIATLGHKLSVRVVTHLLSIVAGHGNH